jgi:hypothetical protein
MYLSTRRWVSLANAQWKVPIYTTGTLKGPGVGAGSAVAVGPSTIATLTTDSPVGAGQATDSPVDANQDDIVVPEGQGVLATMEMEGSNIEDILCPSHESD